MKEKTKGVTRTHPALTDFFSAHAIEAAAVLPINAVRVINEGLLSRAGFAPKSVIVFLLPYYAGECVNLSRYAASLDYHLIISEITGELCDLLTRRFPGSTSKGYGDHSPIDERSAALAAGLGIRGDNGLLIHKKYGSYVFVSDVLTDVDPDVLGATLSQNAKNCEHCGACKSACPTGILRGEGTECLSAITQKKGDLTPDEITLMRRYGTVWGCDICQSVCPHNAHPVPTPIPFFYRDRLPHLTKEILDSMDEESFRTRAFAWRGWKTVERNLSFFDESDNFEIKL